MVSKAFRRNTMPRSFTSDTLNPMISVQNRVLRSTSLTLNTTCPIFLTFMGVLLRSPVAMFVSLRSWIFRQCPVNGNLDPMEVWVQAALGQAHGLIQAAHPGG